MDKHHGLIIVGAAGVALLAYMHFKAGAMVSTPGLANSVETPAQELQELGSQAQYSKGTFTGPQHTTLTEWQGTFNDVPLYQDNRQYAQGSHVMHPVALIPAKKQSLKGNYVPRRPVAVVRAHSV
jgi:hypothetical protein